MFWVEKEDLFLLSYICFLGIVGVPVYAGGLSGIGIIFGNTGGYMIGWLLAGFIMWIMEHLLGRKEWVLALSSILGLLVCYIVGTVWFMVIYARDIGQIGLWTALVWCVIPFIVPDLFKIFLALSVQKRLMPFVD